jgi:uncharacterized membrane protein YgcG
VFTVPNCADQAWINPTCLDHAAHIGHGHDAGTLSRLVDVKLNVKRTLAGVLLAVGISAGGSLATATSASADVEDFTFSSFDADYWLSRDDDGSASLRTVETFVAEFPETDQNRGIIRAISDEYNDLPLNTQVESVVDQNGEPISYEEDDEGDVVVLTIGTEYVHGEQTYVIEYTQHDVVRSFENTGNDELYWDTNGTGFVQPFGVVSARFHIDPELDSALSGDVACYTGEEGSTTECELTRGTDAEGTVFSAEVRDLGPGENVTAAIGFTAGTFVIPDPPQPALWAVILPIIVLVLTGLATLAAVITRTRAPRDAAGRGTIIPEYSVPDESNLFVAGNVSGRAEKSVSAAMVALAVRGNLQIIDNGDDEYSLRYLTDAGTDEQEAELLTALFGKNPGRGKVRSLKKPSTKFATSLRKVLTNTSARVLKLGLRRKVRWTPNVVLLRVLMVLVVPAIVLFILNLALSPAPSVVGILLLPAAIIGVVVGAICAYIPPVLTEPGAHLRDYIAGMRVYLKLAEAERFKMLQSPEGALRVSGGDRATAGDQATGGDESEVVKLYEKLLPYAVLWGIEREWSEELAVRYESAQPSWYVGSSGFNPVLFGASMHSFSQSTTAASSYSAATGASSSGGSMGGGSSGGGGGGGGGGGH